MINLRQRSFLEILDSYFINQFGFRKDRSTQQALALITEHIAHNKTDGGQCQCVLRYIPKAFKKVWHLGSKYKILHLGLSVSLKKLLCDFLDDRSTHLGSGFALECGVPQGSVLSPILFSICTKDTPLPHKDATTSYVDVITQIIGYGGKSELKRNRATEREIHRVNTYETP